MFRQHAGDVVIDDYDLVDMGPPLLGKHPDRRGTAADTHQLLLGTVDDRSLSGLHRQRGAVINVKLDLTPVAQCEQGIAGGPPLGLGASRQMLHAAKR